MNQEEILNMPAGRELDTLVLLDIMNLKPSYIQEGSLFGVVGELDCWYDEGGKFYPLGTSPSTDISWAWKVAEKLSDKFDFALVNNQYFLNYPNLHYGFRLQAIDVHSHIKTVFALGETAPLAICRAALLVVCII